MQDLDLSYMDACAMRSDVVVAVASTDEQMSVIVDVIVAAVGSWEYQSNT